MQRQQQLISEFIRTDKVDPSQQVLAKHQKMALNPFRFLRGSSGLFYADLQSEVFKLPPALLQQVPLTAVMGFVAPHVYGSPQHTCPFCLLHADAWGIGWPLFAALFAALALGLVPALVRGLSRLSGEREQARPLERDAARFALYALVAVVVLEVAPVVRYLVVSGGVSVFGV